MLAMTYLGPSKVKAVKKPDPKLEHPNDVLLRVTRAAICGSDIHLYHGLIPDTRVGSTFGHEFVGVVEEVGPSVQTLARGDRIAVPFNIACGQCYFCDRELYGNCENTNRRRRSGRASSATATRPAATTAARPSSCACRSPTSGR
jgi:threonine dehydrogenase-like Zn-dependent dehydrogenase